MDADGTNQISLTSGRHPSWGGAAPITVQLMRGDPARDPYTNVDADPDVPLEPRPAPTVLTNQAVISKGLVADGVTPLLFKFEQSTPAEAAYDVSIDSDSAAVNSDLYVLNSNQWMRIIPPNVGHITFNGTTAPAFAYLAAPDLTGCFPRNASSAKLIASLQSVAYSVTGRQLQVSDVYKSAALPLS